jgi:hypothetical protein
MAVRLKFMKQVSPAEEARAKYLELCSDLIEHLQAARNHGLKPGNTWIAKAELAKANGLMGEIDQLLGEIKQLDEKAG